MYICVFVLVLFVTSLWDSFSVSPPLSVLKKKKSWTAIPMVRVTSQARTEGPRGTPCQLSTAGLGVTGQTASEGAELVWIRKLWMTEGRMDFREAFCHGDHASMMKHCSGPWRIILLLVNICTLGSKNIILLLMQFSQYLVAEIHSTTFR